MGHIHLGVLPGTRRWQEVVELLTQGAVDEQVIAQAAIAAETDLSRDVHNPVFVEAVRLLLMVPYAARGEDFARALREVGLDVSGEPHLFDLLAATSERLDAVARSAKNRSDFGELAGRALIATFTEQIGGAMPGLFDETPTDVRIAARGLSWRRGIAEVTRGFFGRLVAETLASWLDRALSAHVGPGERFETAAGRSAFDLALQQYASEATRIIQEFAPGWYGKRLHEDGQITQRQAAAFAAICFKKIREELQRKRGADA